MKLTRARVWVSSRFPFLAVLALHLPEQVANIPTAATDGKTLFYNPDYLESLPDEVVRGLLLHLVLHAALGHPWRRGSRDVVRWEIAADVVVNGIIRQLMGVRLPFGADHTEPSMEHLPVEEIYALLPDHFELPSSGQMQTSPETSQLETYWSEARAAALQTQDTPANLERHYPKQKTQTDWRMVLLPYLQNKQLDYAWQHPDRRMMAHDLYYPSLNAQTIRLAVAIDTSGSISSDLIGVFIAELKSLKKSLPNLSGLVLYADAAVHQVHDLSHLEPPVVLGGGGTSYAPVLTELERRRFLPDVLIYLTDGEAEYPKAPSYPVLWLMPEEKPVPWGKWVKLNKT